MRSRLDLSGAIVERAMRARSSVNHRAFHGLFAAWAALDGIGLCACAGKGGSATEGTPPDSGTEPDGGGDSGVRPAHERLDCDLPAVIEYCGGSTCHYDNAAPDVASGLVLWDRQAGRMVADIEARLVGVSAGYRNVPDFENCPPVPELLVDPADVERSLILAKLEARHQCGAEMPKFPYPEWGTVANPGAQREAFVRCIREWVALLVEDYTQAP